MARRHALPISTPPFYPANSRSLQPSLQICTFVFNNFQDAPPATLFLSIVCIVAGGWVASPSVHFKSYLNSLPSCSLTCLPQAAKGASRGATSLSVRGACSLRRESPVTNHQSLSEHPIRMRVLSERSESKDLDPALTLFICHTSKKSPANSFVCHTSKNTLPQVLCLPHLRDPPPQSSLSSLRTL